jgi:hypothetical protein
MRLPTHGAKLALIGMLAAVAMEATAPEALAATPVPTTTTLTSSPNPAAAGQTVTYTATVTSSTGGELTERVEFDDGSGQIDYCGGSQQPDLLGVATCSLVEPPGTHQVTAHYLGDSFFAGSTSASVTEQVKTAPTTTAVTASANPATVGQAVTYTATVTSSSGLTPSGTVTFASGGTTIAGCGSVPLTNDTVCKASYTLPGSGQITATYSGSASFYSSESPPITEQVDAAPTMTSESTTTTLYSSANIANAAQAVTWTAVVTSSGGDTPPGNVYFESASTGKLLPCIQTSSQLSGGSAQCTWSPPVGSYSVIAQYAGAYNSNTGWDASNSTPVNLQVNLLTATMTLFGSTQPATAGQNVTYTFRITGAAGEPSPSGAVLFYRNGIFYAPCQGASVINGISNCKMPAEAAQITATYGGDAYYAAGNPPEFTQQISNVGALLPKRHHNPKRHHAEHHHTKRHHKHHAKSHDREQGKQHNRHR